MTFKAIYLAAGTANIKIDGIEITYQDINGKRDIGGDMLETNLKPYDILIATPPCNYYSRANYRRNESKYSLQTKHLLPEIIKKFAASRKPFIIENVRNSKLMKDFAACKELIHVIYYGRHTYYTNINFYYADIEQPIEYIAKINYKSYDRQGNKNVNKIIERFLKICLTITKII